MQSDTTGSLQEFHKILEEAGKKELPISIMCRKSSCCSDRWKACGYDRGMERVFFHGGTHREIAGQKQQKTFEENGEVEFSCPVFNKRVRVNLFRQSGTCAMSVRLFAEDPDTADAWTSGVGSADGWEEKRTHSCDRCIRKWKDNNDGIDDRPYCF